MSYFDKRQDLFPEARNPENVRAINNRCMIRTQEGHTVVIVSGMILSQYPSDDAMAEAHAMVNLVEQGLADQVDVARAFGCSARTIRRHQQRFAQGGLAALGRKRGYPLGRARLAVSRQKRIEKLKAQGCSGREIASILGVTERAVRKVVRRLGLESVPSSQPELSLDDKTGADPKLSASSLTQANRLSTTDCRARASADSASPKSWAVSPALDVASGADPKLSASAKTEAVSHAPTSPLKAVLSSATPAPVADPKLSALITQDTDPTDRRGDRLLASLGLLDDAAPLFGSARAIPKAGVLLAVPALVRSGVFRCAEKVYRGIGPAFYGLRTSLLTLLLMALWRIKRPEGLKEYSPEDLGRVLGLDRAPEVKTLRRKLTRLSQAGRAAQLGRALAEERVASHSQALGFLYVDGHVRVYHGKHPLPKTHVARMRLSLPATSDYWVNDAQGDPLLVITAEANAGLVKMLPGVLEQVRSLTGSRRTTVVFDRGGFSPKLFQQILAAGFDLLTYRKGPLRRIPRRLFRQERACVDGREVSYLLADQEVRLLKGKLRLRQVTRMSDDGHQTPILTSRKDLAPVFVAYRMFERWRQENFFKYLREEYALDALVEHAAVPDDSDREVPNPAWTALNRKLQQATAELDCLQKEYGIEACQNLGKRRQTVRGFQAAQATLLEKIRAAQKRVDRWRAQRDSILKRVPVQAALQQPPVKLAPERKHLTNLIKMVAYQAETELLRAITPFYRRAGDEGRTLVQSALASAADIDVTSNELRVILAPLSSQHRTRAVAALCEHLNESRTCFPGTQLRLVFAVREHG
jgi:prepilin-type processing-associated H-X9-DG protein